MKDLLIVKVVDGKGNLREPVQDLCFSEIFTFFLHLFDFCVHISELTVYHDDTKITLFICERVLVGYNVDMP